MNEGREKGKGREGGRKMNEYQTMCQILSSYQECKKYHIYVCFQST